MRALSCPFCLHGPPGSAWDPRSGLREHAVQPGPMGMLAKGCVSRAGMWSRPLVGQGCWDLTAPAPGTPSCGGLLSSVRLLAPGLPLAHSPVTCSAVVCCSSFLCAMVGFLGHHQPRRQISSRAWTELQVLSDRVNRGETRNQVGAGDWCSHLCPSAASWPRTRQ